MTSYEIFTLFVCLVVFCILTAVCGLLVYSLVKHQIKLIRYGDYDAEIVKEYIQSKKHKSNKGERILSLVVNIAVSLIFVAVFVFSLIINLREDSFSPSTPTLRVVLSDSMSKKLEENEHLTQNSLDDQFQMFDILFTYQIPQEADLKLYDIVIYEVDETLVIHRIVDIEEPNERHPGERWFTLQGDAVGNVDRFPVRYSQMRGIYRGARIPFAGSFVKFLQSPAGWLCLLLVVGTTLLSPLVDKLIDKHRLQRLLKMKPVLQADASLMAMAAERRTAKRQKIPSPEVEDLDAQILLWQSPKAFLQVGGFVRRVKFKPELPKGFKK